MSANSFSSRLPVRRFVIVVLATLGAAFVPVATAGDNAVYITDTYGHSIVRTPTSHPVPELLLRDGDKVGRGFALVPEAGLMFYTDEDYRQIMRMSLDGSGARSIVCTGLEVPTALDVDPSGAKVYWTDPALGRIQRANFDGTQVEDVINDGADARGMAIDPIARLLYWTDSTAGVVRRSDLDGAGIEDVVSGLVDPRHLVVAPDAGYLFWLDDRRVLRSKLDGSDVRSIFDDEVYSNAPLALDEERGRLYLVTRQNLLRSTDFDGGDVRDVGGSFEVITALAFDPASRHLYWLDPAFGVGRTGADGGETEQVHPNAVFYPYGVDVDPIGRKLYWSRFYGLFRSNLNGSGVERIAEREGWSLEGLAVDGVHGYLYWVENFDAIYRMRLDGTGVEMLPIPDVHQAQDIAVDPAAGYIYWTQWSAPRAIRRAHLDGTNAEVLIDIPSGSPDQITLAPSTGKLYWTANCGIHRANLDGSNRECFLGEYVRDIAFDDAAGALYWCDAPPAPSLSRVDVDGKNLETFELGLMRPRYLAIGPGALAAREGDATGDGVVDPLDIREVLDTWGECLCLGPCTADADENGVVDYRDVLAVLSNWG